MPKQQSQVFGEPHGDMDCKSRLLCGDPSNRGDASQYWPHRTGHKASGLTYRAFVEHCCMRECAIYIARSLEVMRIWAGSIGCILSGMHGNRTAPLRFFGRGNDRIHTSSMQTFPRGTS